MLDGDRFTATIKIQRQDTANYVRIINNVNWNGRRDVNL